MCDGVGVGGNGCGGVTGVVGNGAQCTDPELVVFGIVYLVKYIKFSRKSAHVRRRMGER